MDGLSIARNQRRRATNSCGSGSRRTSFLARSRSVGIVKANVDGDIGISGLGVGSSWPSCRQWPFIRRQHNATAYGGPANHAESHPSSRCLFVRLGSWRVSSARMSHSGVVVAASVAKLCPSPMAMDPPGDVASNYNRCGGKGWLDLCSIRISPCRRGHESERRKDLDCGIGEWRDEGVGLQAGD